MKKLNFYLSLLLAVTLMTSCKKDTLSYPSDYAKSSQSWLDFKSSSANSYRYTVAVGSWVGTNAETTLTVNSGKVVARSYVYTAPAQDRSSGFVVQEQWTENENSLNSHAYGAPIQTLDEVYEKAKTDWLTKRTDADTYFEAKNNGMISSCGYIPRSCQDDCFVGITITNIEKI